VYVYVCVNVICCPKELEAEIDWLYTIFIMLIMYKSLLKC